MYDLHFSLAWNEQRGKEHFLFSPLLPAVFIFFVNEPVKTTLQTQQGSSSTKRGLIPWGSPWTHPVESAPFLRDYSFALESDADDINILSSGRAALSLHPHTHLLHPKFIPTWAWLQLCLFRFYKLVGIISKLVFKQANKTREHHLVLTDAHQTSLPIYSWCADIWKPEPVSPLCRLHVEIQTHEGP